MGNLRIWLSALLLLPAIACGGDSNSNVDAKPADAKAADAKPDSPKVVDAFVPDAQHFDFSCSGSANPTTTQVEQITVGGAAETLSGTSPGPAAGVTVELFRAGSGGGIGSGSGSALDTELTGSDGSFTFAAQPTNGSAVDIFVKATGSGLRPDFVLPAAPLVKDQTDVPVLAISNATLKGFGEGSGEGAFVLLVTDCANARIGGATVSVQQAGSNVGSVVDAGQFEAALNGAYVVLNVPPGQTTVQATVQTTMYRTRTLKSIADATTSTQLLP